MIPPASWPIIQSVIEVVLVLIGIGVAYSFGSYQAEHRAQILWNNIWKVFSQEPGGLVL